MILADRRADRTNQRRSGSPPGWPGRTGALCAQAQRPTLPSPLPGIVEGPRVAASRLAAGHSIFPYQIQPHTALEEVSRILVEARVGAFPPSGGIRLARSHSRHHGDNDLRVEADLMTE